jgi:hypothetical protein
MDSNKNWSREALAYIVKTLGAEHNTLALIGSLRPDGDELLCDAGELRLVTRRHFEDPLEDDDWVTVSFMPGAEEGQILSFESTPAEALAKASQRVMVQQALARAYKPRDGDDPVPDHGPVSSAQVPDSGKCTEAERKVLECYGWPWHPSHWPTIRIDQRDGAEYSPSCATVEDAHLLRSACVKLGVGYFDGDKTVGRKHNHH